MNPWLSFVLGLAVGAGLVALLLRSAYAAHSAVAVAERDVLRERVIDLESSLAEDLETARLLAPLRDALGRVEAQVGTLERDRMAQFGSIRALLARVEGETHELGRATTSLAGSLRSSTTRGAWGEVQLRRVLEVSGMLARCDFEEQVGLSTGRPDVVVRLPGDRSLVIDAKAPMTAFLDAQADGLAADDAAELLREHARSLRGHVGALAGKAYWDGLTGSPELVICFVPGDAMLAAALDADPGLHEWALARRVALVGPAALFALLRTVAHGWRQEAVATNASEVMVLGRELYARLATLGTHTAKLGRSLTSSVEAYNAMVGALESRVLVTARRMHDLDIVSDPLSEQPALEVGPRPLTAMELIDAVTAQDAREELPFDMDDRSAQRADRFRGIPGGVGTGSAS